MDAEQRDSTARTCSRSSARLAARGARPFLLINSDPYTGSDEAAAWWRSVAQVADLVQEDYFSAKVLYRSGPVVANRRMRAAFRRSVAQFVKIGIPVTKIGLMLGFQSAPGAGGREGLQPSKAWYEVVKWNALSARQIAGEMKLADRLVVGLGNVQRGRARPGQARGRLRLSLGALAVALQRAGDGRQVQQVAHRRAADPAERRDVQGRRNSISLSAIARLNILVKDRDVAYTALLGRLAESVSQRATTKEILARRAGRDPVPLRRLTLRVSRGARRGRGAARRRARDPRRLDPARRRSDATLRVPGAERGGDRRLLRVVSGAARAHGARRGRGAVVARREAHRPRARDVRAGRALRRRPPAARRRSGR